MSGLEKFQTCDTWRNQFRKLLFTERCKSAPQSTLSKPRFSLDIEEDLQIIIKQKIPQIVNKNRSEKRSADKQLCKNMSQPPNKDANENLALSCNDTFFEEQEMPQISDESFEAIEKMCDKTASDPNSTLFQYLHSDHQDQVVADAKKRTAFLSNKNSEGNDAEDNALQRLLNDLRIEEHAQLENESPFKDINLTQLEDIEPPSRLWENTVMGESMLQTSPVKIVGLLRPSTIIEENTDESIYSNISSQISNKSTHPVSETSSGSYNTACESLNSGKTADNSNLLDVDVSVFKAAANYKADMSNFTTLSKSGTINLNDSLVLIDLDKTLACSLKEENSNELLTSISEVSIIEIPSDDEISSEKNIYDSVASLSLDSKQTFSFDNGNKENDLELECDKSHNFNDTLEEVEYMMKKGMEYMAAAAASKDLNVVNGLEKTLASTRSVSGGSPLKEKQNTFLISSNEEHFQLPSLKPHKPIVNREMFSKTAESSPKIASPSSITIKKPINRFALEMKPIPKMDVFKRPLPSNIPTSTNARYKDVGKQQFSHIISPIGAYMKKTATTPLMATIKTKNRNADIMNSTAFRELEYESRLYKPSLAVCTQSNSVGRKLPGIPIVTRNLPKKAYISSEFKHIVDERTPFTIPGGKKIQKYLESAMLPAVVRHEGKVKVPGGVSSFAERNSDGTSTHMPRRTTASLANLSVMSGDVSVYTIMDARKF